MMKRLLAPLLCLLPLVAAAEPMPGVRGINHIGLTVPDLADRKSVV